VTDVEKVRVLIGDQTSPQKFADSDLQLFLDLSEGSLLLAAALACDSQAAKVAATLKEQRIGDYQDSSGRNQVTALLAQAEAFRKLEYETPAFAIAEEPLSSMNSLIIIRNYVLRMEP
jgi:hypothetical protein